MNNLETTVSKLEKNLKSVDPIVRKSSLEKLAILLLAGDFETAPPTESVNMHCHTFFSYNPESHTPSSFAWEARKRGLLAAGIVDFDVLDGVDEFLTAAQALELRGAAGLETRVFVPEFATREINSPGEPGIAYHMGFGMPASQPPATQRPFLTKLKQTAQKRNRELIMRVNSFTAPLKLDFTLDVVSLTPGGNATERHICLAYARKAAEMNATPSSLTKFWTEKLGELPEDIDLPEGPVLQGLIRQKTMKMGGVGYVKPDKDSFPAMSAVNEFILACGGVPTMAWLDGTTEGEQAIDELLDVEMATGVEAVNIIPARNFTAGLKDQKLKNLYAFVDAAEKRNMPVLVGTEMNSPGLRFVDNFECPELAPLQSIFLKGAHILSAHSVMQRCGGMGYCSAWGEIHFPDRADRNRFYLEIGETLNPQFESKLTINQGMNPEEIIAMIQH